MRMPKEVRLGIFGESIYSKTKSSLFQ